MNRVPGAVSYGEYETLMDRCVFADGNEWPVAACRFILGERFCHRGRAVEGTSPRDHYDESWRETFRSYYFSLCEKCCRNCERIHRSSSVPLENNAIEYRSEIIEPTAEPFLLEKWIITLIDDTNECELFENIIFELSSSEIFIGKQLRNVRRAFFKNFPASGVVPGIKKICGIFREWERGTSVFFTAQRFRSNNPQQCVVVCASNCRHTREKGYLRESMRGEGVFTWFGEVKYLGA